MGSCCLWIESLMAFPCRMLWKDKDTLLENSKNIRELAVFHLLPMGERHEKYAVKTDYGFWNSRQHSVTYRGTDQLSIWDSDIQDLSQHLAPNRTKQRYLATDLVVQDSPKRNTKLHRDRCYVQWRADKRHTVMSFAGTDSSATFSSWIGDYASASERERYASSWRRERSHSGTRRGPFHRRC